MNARRRRFFQIALMMFLSFGTAMPAVHILHVHAAAIVGQQDHTNSIGMEFVRIPPGSFLMGCSSEDENCCGMEEPQHRVTLTRPFYLGKYEVTQAQWTAVMGNNPSAMKHKDNPVENVSWEDVQEFIRRLNQKEGHNRYRLPTEAEWEYAARAGTTTAYYYGDDEDLLDEYAWHSEYIEDGKGGKGNAHPVGQKKPNPWGLHDIYGNVAEWVQDRHDPNREYYAESPERDPQGPDTGEFRMTRGGSWASVSAECRSASRVGDKPDRQRNSIGFRLALSLEE